MSILPSRPSSADQDHSHFLGLLVNMARLWNGDACSVTRPLILPPTVPLFDMRYERMQALRCDLRVGGVVVLGRWFLAPSPPSFFSLSEINL